MGGSASAVYTLINSYLADRLPDLYVQVDDEIATFPFISVGEVQPIKQESKHFEHYEITQTIRIYHNDINERVTLENIIHKMITELENGSYFVNGWQLDLLNCNYDISVEIDTSTQKYLRLFCELTFKGLLVVCLSLSSKLSKSFLAFAKPLPQLPKSTARDTVTCSVFSAIYPTPFT